MGRISYTEYQSQQNSTTNNDKTIYWYFSLAEDGEKSLIRIMHYDPSTIEIVASHPVEINNKYRRISCIRNAKDPIDMCPLCANDAILEKKIYVHLIEYTKGENGEIVATPKVWERPTGFFAELQTLFDNYEVQDEICIATRTGKGSQTRYKVLPATQKGLEAMGMPTDLNCYTYDPTVFDNYTVLGTNIQERDANDILEGLEDGSITFEKPAPKPISDFPAQKQYTPINAAPIPTAKAQQTTYTQPVAPVQQPIQQPVYAPQPQSVPFEDVPTLVPPVEIASVPQYASNPLNNTPRRTYTVNPVENKTQNTTTNSFRPIRN